MELGEKVYSKIIMIAMFECLVLSFAEAALNPTIEEIFTEEYNTPLYRVSDRVSRGGIASALSEMSEKLGVYKLIDAGCGDPNALQSIFHLFDYQGIDVVDVLLENNRIKYGNEKVNFTKIDITQNPLPEGDMVLCSDCLEWLSYYDIFITLEQFKESKSKYLLLSTYPSVLNNQETRTGIPRKVNWETYPFYFPPPMQLIKESADSGRYFGLWKFEDIILTRFYGQLFQPLTVLSKPVGNNLSWEHPAVMNSVRRGLPKMHREFNINTDSLSSIKSNVVVTADITAGLQAYQWKLNDQIQTLMVGPNIASNVEEANSFISWPLIDAFLSPSAWPALNLIRFDKRLEDRTRIWFAGVDENYWKPSLKWEEKNSNQVLIYCKTNPEICAQVEECLASYGYESVRIHYGNYKHDEFKSLLSKCKFAVFVSISESQGLALAEAWSMDVPTLIWNPKVPVTHAGYTWEDICSSPYLNPMVGKEWNTIEELKILLNHFEKDCSDFQPRRWILLNMTDKVSMERLMDLVREMNPPNA